MEITNITQILRENGKPEPPLQRFVYRRDGNELKAFQRAAREYIPGFVVDGGIEPLVKTLIAWTLCDDSNAHAVNIADGSQTPADMFKGFYIAGPTGSGKTTLLYAYDCWLRTRRMQIATYGHMRDLLLPKFGAKDICREFRQYGDEALDIVRRLPIVLIDDIGADDKESSYMGSKVDVIAELILYRADNPDCITWYTSNLPLRDPTVTQGNPLLDRYGARVVSRLVGSCNYLKLVGDDRRLKQTPR